MIINVHGTRKDTGAEEYLYTTAKHKTLKAAMEAFHKQREITVSSVPSYTIRPDDYSAVAFHRAATV